jgi:lipoyl(octanoyl) transferase
MKKPLVIKRLGVVDYAACLLQMQSFVANRKKEDQDELWVLQHNCVFTMGAMASNSDILVHNHDIPIIKTDRGGKITFHGPGQIIIYLLLDINKLGINTRQLVHKIEYSILDMLSHLGIDAYISMNNPGIYVDQYCTIKIASIGLKINKEGYSYHGISVNFNIDKNMFSYINPCGQVGLKIVNILDLNSRSDINDVENQLINAIIARLYSEKYK